MNIERLRDHIPESVTTEEDMHIVLNYINSYLYQAFGFLESPMEHMTQDKQQGMCWHGHHYRQKMVRMCIDDIEARMRENMKL